MANWSGPSAGPGDQCRAAARLAEHEMGIAPGLLAAIAQVESGRRDPQQGSSGPWPWTVSAEGQGRYFETKEEAVAHVRKLQARGVQLIDVGCMQVNLLHHPAAFAGLEEAFDPVANARYAARFLKELQATRNDWMLAASHYHSQTPARAEAYRARIASAWPLAQRRAADPGGMLAEAWSHARPGGRAQAAATATARLAMPKQGWTGMRMLSARSAATGGAKGGATGGATLGGTTTQGRTRLELAEAP
jgi:hypothetical protein